MQKLIKFQLIIFLVIYNLTLNVFAQLKSDSLEIELSKALIDSVKIKLMLDICWDLKSADGEKALEYGTKALDLAKKTKNLKLQAIALKNIGIIFLFTGDYQKSEEYHLNALEIFKLVNNSKGISGCNNNLGMIYQQKGDFIKAVEHYENSLQTNKAINNKTGVASSLTNLGNIFQQQGNYSQAIEYYIEVLKIREELKDKHGIADIYNNIGALNEKQREFDNALRNYQKALILYTEVQNKRKLSNVLHNIGSVLKTQNQYTQALEYYFQALEIRKKFNAKKGIAATTLSIGELYQILKRPKQALDYYNNSLKIYKEIDSKPGISSAYYSIGTYYQDIKKYNEAILYFEKALLIAKELELRWDIKLIYKKQSLVYASWQKYAKAYEYSILFEQMKDSLTNEKNSNNIIELQLQFEFEKHQKEMELKTQIEKLNTIRELNKQRTINYSLFGGISFLLLLAFIVYRAYLFKKKDNIQLKEQKYQINQKNEELLLYQEEINSQKENLQVQNEVTTSQLKDIAKKNQKINDSIQYASRIQQALLPPEELFSDYFTDYFLLNKPKDIVSGDFYWLKHYNNKIFLAVADSTGHGVPGAFMSLLGISFLNEQLKNSEHTNAAEILNKLRNSLKESLNRKGNKSENRDGIDIAFCIIDKSAKEIQFAGAYNPLIIIKEATNNKPAELIELKGDKMPIGVHHKGKEFTNQVIKIDDTDRFYLFTDGYIDQFGGVDGRKFLINNFKKLLLNIHTLAMSEQKSELIKVHDNWKEELDQIDDILILGFSV